VPAEVLAVFVTWTGIAGTNTDLVRFSFLIALVLAPAYLGYHAAKPNVRNPRWYMYVLAAIGFAVWAPTTSDVLRGLISVDTPTSQWALSVTVFTLPLVDWVCVKLFGS
jgi:hypothetical protein